MKRIGWGALLALFLVSATFAPAQEQAQPQTPWIDSRDAWGLPKGASTYAKDVDQFYYYITYIVGTLFILTEGILLYCLFRFRRREGHKPKYIHSNKTLEIVWTVIPGIILVLIAVTQYDVWTYIKAEMPKESESIVVQVFPRQFEWHYRYAGADGRFGGKDDVLVQNTMVVPVGRKILIKLRSRDVIHSFYLPHMRVKQDAVPGLPVLNWFEVTMTTEEFRKYLIPPAVRAKLTDPVVEAICMDLEWLQDLKTRDLLNDTQKAELKARQDQQKKALDDARAKLTPEEFRQVQGAAAFNYEVACAEL